MPDFALAIILSYWVGVKLKWLPTSGFTHFSDDELDISGAELLLLTETISILLQSCFLTELEVSSERQSELLKASRYFGLIRENRSTLQNAIDRFVIAKSEK
jgi:ABC-type dipeptide/oligopeptide/nickel transport system permease component